MDCFESVYNYIVNEITWQEIIAVICAIIYIILAAKRSVWCWLFGNISCAFYVYLALAVFNLPLEAPLNAYYIIMGFYGWCTWNKDKVKNDDLTIVRKPFYWHLKWIGIGIVLTLILGYIVSTNFEWLPEMIKGAKMSYLDAFTTTFAFIATYLLATKVLENWCYWIAADTAAIVLYGGNGYYFSALLFLVYVIMSINGLAKWKDSFNVNKNP